MLVTEFHKLYKEKGLSPEVIQKFQAMINAYFKQSGRKFPFREKIDPYHVLVSEIMLQQTQTGAVSEKFLKFIEQFPDFESLAKAPQEKVLQAWQGLGYNRRAIALKKIASIVIEEHGGKLPQSLETLKKLPQIGFNTASSILAFAFNKPVYFVETNIRRVYIYFFFPNQKNINDKEILEIVEKTTDNKNPRCWYYALMDYGVMLKKTHPNLNKRSAHYKKQAPFKGSNREIRGKILRLMLNRKSIVESKIASQLKVDAKRAKQVIDQLVKESFFKRQKNKLILV